MGVRIARVHRSIRDRRFSVAPVDCARIAANPPFAISRRARPGPPRPYGTSLACELSDSRGDQPPGIQRLDRASNRRRSQLRRPGTQGPRTGPARSGLLPSAQRRQSSRNAERAPRNAPVPDHSPWWCAYLAIVPNQSRAQHGAVALATAPSGATPHLEPRVRLSFAFARERDAVAAVASMRHLVTSVAWEPPKSDADLAVVHVSAEGANRDRAVTIAGGMHGVLVGDRARPAAPGRS